MAGTRIPSGAYPLGFALPDGSGSQAYAAAAVLVDTSGNPASAGGGSSALPAGTDRSGSATTSSGGLTVPANASRVGLVGQNASAVSIGFNEHGGTAAIGSAGTYTVPAGSSFSISTNKAVNFIAASGTAPVTMTEY